MGIVNGEDFQIVYSDTPGFIKPAYQLQEAMVKSSRSAFSDADILLYVTDVNEKPDKNEEFLGWVGEASVPVIVIINKIDLSDQEKVLSLQQQWTELLPKAEIYVASALHQFNVHPLLNRILELLPVSPPYFDKEMLTDRPQRFFVTEILRGVILSLYDKEIPYSVEPVVEEFKESDDLIRIRVIIYVERASQKGILIGHQGSMLKKTGTLARKDIEQFFDKKVFLETHVKVLPDWRNRPEMLRRFGYEI